MIRVLLVLTLPILLNGCLTYVAPVMPPGGFMFSSIAAPIDTDAEATPVASKVGEAKSFSVFFGMFAFGDASTDSAAQDGGITTIHHLDYHYMNVFFFMYQSFTTRAYGE